MYENILNVLFFIFACKCLLSFNKNTSLLRRLCAPVTSHGIFEEIFRFCIQVFVYFFYKCYEIFRFMYENINLSTDLLEKKLEENILYLKMIDSTN